MTDVILEYRREGDVFTGVIHGFLGGSKQPYTEIATFEKASFQRMILHLSDALRRHQGASCVWRRTERTPPIEFAIEPELVGLIKSDPLSAVRSMEFGVEKTPQLLPAGYDSLAETFGDVVFLRRVGNLVECPVCGQNGWLERGRKQCRLLCRQCTPHRRFEIDELSRRWVGVGVPHLLEDQSEKFWLPRQWNPGDGWIGKAELQQKFDEFSKERDDV